MAASVRYGQVEVSTAVPTRPINHELIPVVNEFVQILFDYIQTGQKDENHLNQLRDFRFTAEILTASINEIQKRPVNSTLQSTALSIVTLLFVERGEIQSAISAANLTLEIDQREFGIILDTMPTVTAYTKILTLFREKLDQGSDEALGQALVTLGIIHESYKDSFYKVIFEVLVGNQRADKAQELALKVEPLSKRDDYLSKIISMILSGENVDEERIQKAIDAVDEISFIGAKIPPLRAIVEALIRINHDDDANTIIDQFERNSELLKGMSLALAKRGDNEGSLNRLLEIEDRKEIVQAIVGHWIGNHGLDFALERVWDRPELGDDILEAICHSEVCKHHLDNALRIANLIEGEEKLVAAAKMVALTYYHELNDVITAQRIAKTVYERFGNSEIIEQLDNEREFG